MQAKIIRLYFMSVRFHTKELSVYLYVRHGLNVTLFMLLLLSFCAFFLHCVSWKKFTHTQKKNNIKGVKDFSFKKVADVLTADQYILQSLGSIVVAIGQDRPPSWSRYGIDPTVVNNLPQYAHLSCRSVTCSWRRGIFVIKETVVLVESWILPSLPLIAGL